MENKTTGLTLSEALATGRPFKHKSWENFYIPNSLTLIHNASQAYEPVWENQEEEKPPMRVWGCRDSFSGELRNFSFGSECINQSYKDITEDLAAALAPLIKKELGL